MKLGNIVFIIFLTSLLILGNTTFPYDNVQTDTESNVERLNRPNGWNLFYTIEADWPDKGEVDAPYGFEDVVRVTFKFGWALSYDRPDVSIYWSPDNVTNWQSKPTTYLYESQPYWYYEVYFGGFDQGQDVYFYLGCNLTTEGWIDLGPRQSWTQHFKVNEDDFYGLNYLPNSGYNVRWGDPEALSVSFRVFHDGWQIDIPDLTLYTSPTNNAPWTPWVCEMAYQTASFYYFECVLGGFERGQEMYFYISGSGFNSFHYNFTCSSGPLMTNPRIFPDTIWPETAFDIVCNISDDEYGMTLYDPIVGYRVNGGSWTYVDMALLANTTYLVHIEAQGICNFEYVCAAVNDNDEMSSSDILFRRIDKIDAYLYLQLSDTSITRGQLVLLSGHIYPAMVRNVTLQYSFDDSEWVNISTSIPNQLGQYSVFWKPGRGGDYYVRSIMFGDIHHYTVSSLTRELEVIGPTTSTVQTPTVTTSITTPSETMSSTEQSTVTQTSSTPTTTQPPVDGSDIDQYNTMIYLGIGVGAVVIILVVVMIKRR